MNDFIPTKVIVTDSKGNRSIIDAGGPFRILLVGEYILYPLDGVGRIKIETEKE